MEIFAAIAVVVAAAAGFLFGKKNSSNEAEKNRLEQLLKEKTTELDAFHSKVNNHFEKTAELFNHVSDSYQSLYDHMAKSSTQLCASQTFQVLPKSTESETATEENPVLTQKNNDGELFDADHLYNAHDYRNKEEEQQKDEPEQVNVKDNTVVEIASANKTSDEPALDYAVKEKGVVNHNSLDVDGVKSS
jgi:uncharacterized membrane-anchored protein YhcB (DUF1043 family)